MSRQQLASELVQLCLDLQPHPSDRWPLEALGLQLRADVALHREAAETVGDVRQLIMGGGIGMIEGLGNVALRHIAEGLRALRRLDDAACTTLEASAVDGLPSLPAQTLIAIADATSLNAELDALLMGLTPRNKALVLGRWAGEDGKPGLLEDLGRKHRLSRERVRQLVEAHETYLISHQLSLPIASSITRLIEEGGGVIAPQALEAALADRGTIVTRRALCLLPTLGRLGFLNPSIYYLEDLAVLSIHKDPNERAHSLLRETWSSISEAINRHLSRAGAVPLELLDAWPFGAAHALKLARPRFTAFEEIAGYVVPVPTRRSALTRAIDEMLAVTPRLRIDDARSGLKRVRRKIEPVPGMVLLTILRNSGRYEVNDTIIAAKASHNPSRALSGSDRVAIEVIESAGGAILWNDLVDGITAKGYSTATACMVPSQPYIVRLSLAIYGLRGRPSAPSLLQELKRRRDEAAASSRRVLNISPDVIEVRWRLGHFALQGVLSIPASISDAATAWTARTPGKPDSTLRAAPGFLWTVRPWLTHIGAAAGDTLVATFFLADASVEFNEPVRGE